MRCLVLGKLVEQGNRCFLSGQKRDLVSDAFGGASVSGAGKKGDDVLAERGWRGLGRVEDLRDTQSLGASCVERLVGPDGEQKHWQPVRQRPEHRSGASMGYHKGTARQERLLVYVSLDPNVIGLWA